MGVLKKIFSAGASTLVDSVGGVIDDLVTTDDERMAAKAKLKQIVLDHEAKMEQNITDRWTADMNSDSWLSKNVRPLVLVWCICIFSLAGILDSIDNVPFHINATWNDTFEKVMMAVVLAYFGGRTTEKATSLFKK